jgi:AcrR family transcriptional regulator
LPRTKTSGDRPDGAGEEQGAGLGVRSAGPHALHPTAQKILEAARKVLLESGYQSMTLQAIAAEAQVNKAGVWYYFGGKQQLVHALLQDITVGESLNFGTLPGAQTGLEERVDLLVGTEQELRKRVGRFRAIYELLPEASRDEDLREHLRTYYRAWYEWAAAVLAPVVAKESTAGQFASVLLDGIIMQVVVGAPEFDLAAALAGARRSLLAEATAAGVGASGGTASVGKPAGGKGPGGRAAGRA